MADYNSKFSRGLYIVCANVLSQLKCCCDLTNIGSAILFYTNNKLYNTSRNFKKKCFTETQRCLHSFRHKKDCETMELYRARDKTILIWKFFVSLADNSIHASIQPQLLQSFQIIQYNPNHFTFY